MQEATGQARKTLPLTERAEKDADVVEREKVARCLPLIGIDGVKLPSNASKQRSGTRANFERQAAKLEAAATAMLERHRAADTLPTEPDLLTKEAKRLAQLKRDASQLREWLAVHPEERRGRKAP